MKYKTHQTFMLAKKLALVTGSTSGIGLGIARSLAKNGSDLILNGFGNHDEIARLRQSLEKEYNVSVKFSGANLANVAEIEGMFSEFGERGIDILVNNAGIQHVSPVASFPKDAWDKVIAINLTAVFHTTRLALPAMKTRNWGRIINIASVHGLVGSVDKSAYVASKHGVLGFTKVTALEYARTGITSNAICPGWVLTPLVQQQIDKRAEKLGVSVEEAKRGLLSEKQPSAEFVTTSQLGDLASFLASDSASEVRGVAWQMDGGWTAQ